MSDAAVFIVMAVSIGTIIMAPSFFEKRKK